MIFHWGISILSHIQASYQHDMTERLLLIMLLKVIYSEPSLQWQLGLGLAFGNCTAVYRGTITRYNVVHTHVPWYVLWYTAGFKCQVFVLTFAQYYRIRPNYRTVRLGFSYLQDTLICGQICIYLLRIHYKKDQKRTHLMMTMWFFLTFFTKAYVVGTHLNCTDLSMQFKWVSSTYAFVKK